MVKKEVDTTSGGSKISVPLTDDAPSKGLVLETIIKRIEYYSNKNSVNDVDLYYLIKDFFREFLDLKYEFSLDELISELDKIYLDAEQREQTFKFIHKVKIIEYHDSSFSEIKIRGFILEFLEIAKSLIKNTDYEHKNFWTRLKSSFRKKQKTDDVDYYKRTHSNEQVDVPVPIPPDLTENKTDESLDVVTETEFSSSNKKLEDAAPSEDLTEYKSEPKIKKRKESKQSKDKQNIAKNETNNNQNSAVPSNLYELPIYRKSYTSLNMKEENNSVKNENWNSDFSLEQRDMAKEDKNNWAEPVEDIINGKSNKKNTAENTENIFEKPEKQKTKNKKTINLSSKKGKLSRKKEKDKTRQGTDRKTQKVQAQKAQKMSKQISIIKNKKKVVPETNSSVKVKNKKTQKPKQTNGKLSLKKTELDQLISSAKKVTNKSELMSLYKRINTKYESSNIEIQAKFYKSVMDIYKRLSKLK
jgi:hypothetical protein